ncbi:SpoU rRNA methylase [Colletotrichum truncatum]|uniref:SpoU rRNA methylase n=1 Tax=Colletotrichum truncatum TaxID=5467 RepID=A0ACC3ZEF8_COLTU|nr:SpoU rRNA methylase [Colletotrichum truncatum]KAF6801375.1 SpoU rRNA methylase [Colletotrichum truncatum]
MSLLLKWSAIRPYKTPNRALQLYRNPGQLRYASLSAIHRGLRRSERVNSRTDRAKRPDSKSRMTESRGRNRTRNDFESKPDAFADRFKGAIGGPRGRERHFKPKKALQKMQEQEEEGGRKSRSKRFNDPEFTFGKKSLVYQLNRGELKDKVSRLLDKDGTGEKHPASPRPGSAWRQNFGRDSMRPRREEGQDSMRSMRDGARKELEGGGAGPRKRSSYRSEDDSSTKKSTEFPISIQYTTAASQFLFGRSVVKAALRNSRRKLYNLYIYQGSNKKDTKDDEWIVSLAQKKKVKINRIYEADQRLLDKMSKGRPHNGIVLEASPLPQLPLTSLGAESSESNGYTVSVAHQSKEAADINGAEGFIPCKPGLARPLVLLLNEILDPGNLGAILRTARFLGVSAVAITQRTSSTITSTVLKAAAGAAEELRLFTVEDPVSFLDASQKAGWASFAAVAPTFGSRGETRQWTPDAIEDSKPLNKEPCILVLGNEGSGLPHEIRRKATHEVTIPRMLTTSSVDSLNVSVAAALLCNSFFRGVRQRHPLTLTEKLQVDARKADGGEGLF